MQTSTAKQDYLTRQAVGARTGLHSVEFYGNGLKVKGCSSLTLLPYPAPQLSGWPVLSRLLRGR